MTALLRRAASSDHLLQNRNENEAVAESLIVPEPKTRIGDDEAGVSYLSPPGVRQAIEAKAMAKRASGASTSAGSTSGSFVKAKRHLKAFLCKCIFGKSCVESCIFFLISSSKGGELSRG